LPLKPLELRHRARHALCGRVRSRNICFGHVPVAVRQGQRRDTLATGEERHGGCATGKSTYIRRYRQSGKLALAPIHLRRARVAGRSFAAGAQPLTHVCTVGACGKKLGVGLQRFLMDPQCIVASFEVNSEPHTGARSSARLCVELKILPSMRSKVGCLSASRN
jgi:hypothetical protein